MKFMASVEAARMIATSDSAVAVGRRFADIFSTENKELEVTVSAFFRKLAKFPTQEIFCDNRNDPGPFSLNFSQIEAIIDSREASVCLIP